MSDDKMNALLTILRHREELQDGLHNLSDELKRRARAHDRSKLQLDEFTGFSRINKRQGNILSVLKNTVNR